MVIATKNAAQNMITKYEYITGQGVSGVSLEEETVAYTEALTKLRTEAEVEGGDVHKELQVFLYFVSSHALRFIGEAHRDPTTAGIFTGRAEDDVPDSFRFMALLQEKSRLAIESLSQ